MHRKTMATGFVVVAVLGLLITAYAAIMGAKKEGLVEYVGAQKVIFREER